MAFKVKNINKDKKHVYLTYNKSYLQKSKEKIVFGQEIIVEGNILPTEIKQLEMNGHVSVRNLSQREYQYLNNSKPKEKEKRIVKDKYKSKNTKGYVEEVDNNITLQSKESSKKSTSTNRTTKGDEPKKSTSTNRTTKSNKKNQTNTAKVSSSGKTNN